MAAIDHTSGHDLTIREAAAACGISPRTIRRKLNTEAFPNAYKLRPRAGETEGVWKIPVGDLEEAGLAPTLLHPTHNNGNAPTSPAEPEGGGPTVLELVRSDRFGRLRAELAEAVAAAEIALLRAEAERWRSLADERADGARPRRHRPEGAHDRDEQRSARCRCARNGNGSQEPAPGAGRHRRGAAARARGSDALHRDVAGAPRPAQAAEPLVAVLAGIEISPAAAPPTRRAAAYFGSVTDKNDFARRLPIRDARRLVRSGSASKNADAHEQGNDARRAPRRCCSR